MKSPVKHIFWAIILYFIRFSCYCQSIQCSDSIGSYYYNIHNISSSPYKNNTNSANDVLNSSVVDNSDNLIIQLDTADKNKNGFTFGIAKLNPQNKLLFRKVFHNKAVFDSIEYVLSFANKNNDIILSGTVVDEHSGYIGAGAIATLDSSGNMKWQKKYRNSDPAPANFSITQSCEGKNNDIIAFSSDINSVNPYKIALLDSIGNIKWARSYDSFDPVFHNVYGTFIAFNGTEIILMGQFIYDSTYYKRSGFCISRIDYTTGKLIESKSYRIVSDQPYIFPFWTNNYNHLNYSLVSKKYMIDLFPEDRQTQGLMMIALNENLDIIRARMFNINVSNSLCPTSINPFNKLAYCYSSFKDTSLLYAQIDEDLNLISQKKIKLNAYPVTNYLGQPVFRKNGLVNIQVFSMGSSGLNNFLQLENSSAYGVNNDCLGYDTSFLSPADVTIIPLKIKIDTESNLPLSVEVVPVLSSEDRGMPEQVYCKQLSICDTIKMHGASHYCLADSVAKITLYKNPQCLRKTEWLADTTALKIISQPDDTTLYLKLLQPYNGYVYANFSGCGLKDSFKINVTNAKQEFAINKDSVLCPGKTILLHATGGFKTYHWQDGDSSASYLVKTPGLYSITATDSCGNIFKDSIAIKNDTTSFSLPASGSICPYDTLQLMLSSSINNITYQPFENVLQRNNRILFFPQNNTQYFLTGKTINNCDISASIAIKVNDCPEYIYFPNSFTPNGDGKNDLFRPYFGGKIDKYNLKIFNRWGQLVFSSINPSNGWDGTYKGVIQGENTYVFICNYRFKNGIEKFVRGEIILLK